MTAPVLKLADLLAPIPGVDPAGEPISYTLREQLRADRKDTEPNPESPALPDIPRNVDWKGILNRCEEALSGESKDLQLAMHLVEAATRVHGFAGLRDGLQLLHGLVTACWDRLHPLPDGDDFEGRVQRFHWLSDTERGALFPNTIKGVPLVSVDGKAYSFYDRQLAGEGRGPISAADFERCNPVSPTVAQELQQAVANLGLLEKALEERLGANVPGMSGLRQALEDCNKFMVMLVRLRTPNVSQGDTEEGTSATGAEPASNVNGLTPQPSARLGNMRNRDDAYRQLAQIADFLEHLEPHSPVPDMLRRAIELGKKPFRELVCELVRDPAALAEVRREFGAKGKEEQAS